MEKVESGLEESGDDSESLPSKEESPLPQGSQCVRYIISQGKSGITNYSCNGAILSAGVLGALYRV